MERIQDTKGLEYKDFEIPSSVEEKTVCTETGLLPQAVVLLLQSISQKTMLRQRAAVVTMLPHQKIPRKMILRVLMRTHLLQVPILPEQPHHRILPLLGQQPNLLPAETLLEQPEQLQVILPAALLVATLEAEVPLNK